LVYLLLENVSFLDIFKRQVLPSPPLLLLLFLHNLMNEKLFFSLLSFSSPKKNTFFVICKSNKNYVKQTLLTENTRQSSGCC